VLGALLNGPIAGINPFVDVAATGLDESDFAAPRNQHVYAAIVATYLAHDRPDVALVAAELQHHGLLEAAGGIERLHELQADVPTISNAGKYAAIVRDHARRRRIIMLAADVTAAAYDDDPNAIARAVTELNDFHAERPTTSTLIEPVDWAELFARDRTSEDWLVPDLWPRGRQISLTAPRKERKSLLMLDLAACLARGVDPWTGRPATPMHVGYFDFEMTEDDLLERVEDMCLNTTDLARLHYFLHPNLPMLDQPDGGRMLLDLIEQYKLAAVVIDTFSRVVSTKDYTGHEVREFYRWSAQHVKARGVSLARLDHTGHEVRDRPAGTSAKGADVDVGWVIHPGEHETMTLRHHGLTRVRWVPSHLDLFLTEEPLRFTRAQRTWVRKAGKGRKREVVLDAVAWRREQPLRLL
jgi:hypothetical protein